MHHSAIHLVCSASNLFPFLHLRGDGGGGGGGGDRRTYNLMLHIQKWPIHIDGHPAFFQIEFETRVGLGAGKCT